MPVNFPTMPVVIRSTWALSTIALAIASAACGGSEEVSGPSDVSVVEADADAAPTGGTSASDDTTPEADVAVPVDVAPQTVAVAPAAEAPVAAIPEPTEAVAERAADSSLAYCSTVPLAAKAATVRKVADYGAKPNDSADDTDAIQKALDALNPGETLSFAAGRYLIKRSLHARRSGITLDGAGSAVIHGTNVDDQALFVEADNITVASLTFTAVTSGRRSAPRHARISVVASDGAGDYRTVRNTVIRNNRIVNSGAPGTPEANAASAGGIFLIRADGFLIANNTVVRTLADAIHMTNGSRNGRVLNNEVREVGDDMIAMVSYATGGTAALNTAAKLRDGWDAKVDKRLVRNIMVAGNKVSGQYWGRGISVVGGESITIRNNTIENVPVAAGILVAREANYQTFGVHNVLIENNVLRDVQTKAPVYDPAGKYSASTRTGHGAIEIHSGMFADEAADSVLRSALSVRNIVARGNTVERTNVSGVRAGVNMNKTVSAADASGKTVNRTMVTGVIGDVSVQGGRFAQLNGSAINVVNSALQASGINCSGNQLDGKAYTTAACKVPTVPAPKGALLRCAADGKVI